VTDPFPLTPGEHDGELLRDVLRGPAGFVGERDVGAAYQQDSCVVARTGLDVGQQAREAERLELVASVILDGDDESAWPARDLSAGLVIHRVED
jgi:hypothetical protein